MFDKKNFRIFKNELLGENILLTIESYPMIVKKKLEVELKIFYLF